jgi:predicted small lipoprotein YifL
MKLRLLMIAAFAALFALSACGKKGDLAPPPAQEQPEDENGRD